MVGARVVCECCSRVGMVSGGPAMSSASAEVRQARSFCLARCALLLTAVGDSPRTTATSREPRPSAESIMTISRSSAESSASAAASALDSGVASMYARSAASARASVVAACLSPLRRFSRAAFRATPNSHGRASDPAGMRARFSQATRKV